MKDFRRTFDVKKPVQQWRMTQHIEMVCVKKPIFRCGETQVADGAFVVGNSYNMILFNGADGVDIDSEDGFTRYFLNTEVEKYFKLREIMRDEKIEQLINENDGRSSI